MKVKCSHLITCIGSKTIAVVFNFYFDVVSGALPTSAQALHMKKIKNNM